MHTLASREGGLLWRPARLEMEGMGLQKSGFDRTISVDLIWMSFLLFNPARCRTRESLARCERLLKTTLFRTTHTSPTLTFREDTFIWRLPGLTLIKLCSLSRADCFFWYLIEYLPKGTSGDAWWKSPQAKSLATACGSESSLQIAHCLCKLPIAHCPLPITN